MSNVDVHVAGVSAVIDNAQRAGLIWRLLPATVVNATSIANVQLIVDGDDQGVSRAMSLIGPVRVNQRVMVMVVPPQGNYIIGTYADVNTGFVDEVTRTSTIGTFTTTETLLDQITFTAVDDARYKLTWVGHVQSGIVGDIVQLRCRWMSGNTLDNTGTLFSSHQVNIDIAGRAMNETIIKTVTGIGAGEISIGVLAVRSSGSGAISSNGSANNEVSLLLEVY